MSGYKSGSARKIINDGKQQIMPKAHRGFKQQSTEQRFLALKRILHLRDLVDMPLVHRASKQKTLSLDATRVKAILNEYRLSHFINKSQFLAPEKIHSCYQNYTQGTFNINFSHLQHIIPGITVPDRMLLDRLIKRDKQFKAEQITSMLALETAMLVSIVKALKPRTVLEIGTNQGYLTKEIAQHAPQDAIILTLDLPPSKLHKARYQNDLVNNEYIKHDDRDVGRAFLGNNSINSNIIQLFGDSAQIDFSLFEGLIDLVIVDGSHIYQNAKVDFLNAKNMVSKGGLIVGDDFGKLFRLEGVTRAVCELANVEDHLYYWLNFQDSYQTSLVISPNF